MTTPIPPRNPIHDYGPIDKLPVQSRVMDVDGNLGTIWGETQGVVEVLWDLGFKEAGRAHEWKGRFEPVFTCKRCGKERPYSEGSGDSDDCDTCWITEQV